MERWFVRKTNPDFIQYISRNASISPLLAQILTNRGINSPEKIQSFLSPHIGSLSDPFSLPDMQKAVRRIEKAFSGREKVLVHGDYDADGVTATSILVLTLRKLGIDCDYFIPNRFDHGYGFNREAIVRAEGTGTTLIVTVDCGISSFEEVQEANSRGIDVIITDHHEPVIDEQGLPAVPAACAVVNPKLAGGGGGPALCGAGIALRLSEALLGPEAALDLFDLAAIGTVADMVPLLDDNRVIVKNGLQLINDGTRASIAILKEVASVSERTITAGMLSYTLIPRINASGRISEASDVVRFFISRDRDEAYRIARRLNSNNSQRHKIEESVFAEALAMMNGRPPGQCIVLWSETWHEGVIGIVASKIAEMFRRPAFIFSIKNDIARGSARSIPSFDICSGLSLCSDFLIRYGGHKQAAGVTMSSSFLAHFENRMNGIISDTLHHSDFQPLLLIDAEVALREINFPFIRELSKLEPFGFANEEPLFAARGLEVVGPRVVGKSHLKMRLKHNSLAIDAIGFDMSDKYDRLESSGIIDAAFVPVINEWNGGKSLQLIIKAFRPSL